MEVPQGPHWLLWEFGLAHLGACWRSVNLLFWNCRDLCGMAGKTRTELARRLGIPEEQLISRQQAAEILGLDEDTLRTKANQHVGFFRLSATKAARALYPLPWVLRYKLWREGGRITSFPEEIAGPERPWPPAPEEREIGPRLAMWMVERWKYRELHERFEAICTRQSPLSELRERNLREQRLLFDDEGRRRSVDDPEVHEALVAKAREVVAPFGVFAAPDRLATLVKVVWEHVVSSERQFLADAPPRLADR